MLPTINEVPQSMLAVNSIERVTITSKWFRIRLDNEQLVLRSNQQEALRISEEAMLPWDRGQEITTMLRPTVQARRISNPTSRHPITIIRTKERCSTNCSRVRVKGKPQIYKSSKSKWKVKNKELPQLNVKLSKRETPDMKKRRDNFQSPNKEQDQLQSNEMAVTSEILKFKTELARNPNLLITSVRMMSKTYSK